MYIISILLMLVLFVFEKLMHGEFSEKKNKPYLYLSAVTLLIFAGVHLYLLCFFLAMGKQYVEMFRAMEVDVKCGNTILIVLACFYGLQIFEVKVIPAANIVMRLTA